MHSFKAFYILAQILLIRGGEVAGNEHKRSLIDSGCLFLQTLLYRFTKYSSNLDILRIFLIYISYLCTNDLYGPVRNVFDAWISKITRASGRGLAMEIESFLGPVKWHRSKRRVPFGAQKILIPMEVHLKIFISWDCTFTAFSSRRQEGRVME